MLFGNGSRLGLRVIGPGGQPMYMEAWQLYVQFRTMERHILRSRGTSREALLEFARQHRAHPPSWSDASRGETQPSRSQVKLKPAPDWIVIEAIKCVYDAAEAAHTKPPNINELPAAVQPILQQQGYYSSGLQIKQLGDREEFKRRRRPPGRTVASERRKK